MAGLQPLVTWTRAPRAVLTVGDLSVDAGPLVTITSDEMPIAQAVMAWRTAADAHTARAEAASLALADHQPVAAASAVAQAAEEKTAELNERLDADEVRLRQLTENAAAAAAKLIGEVVEWTNGNRPLVQPPADAPDDEIDLAAYGDGWDAADVEALHNAEPGQVLYAADSFASIASTRANTRAGRLRAEPAPLISVPLTCAAKPMELRAKRPRFAGQAARPAAARLGGRRRRRRRAGLGPRLAAFLRRGRAPGAGSRASRSRPAWRHAHCVSCDNQRVAGRTARPADAAEPHGSSHSRPRAPARRYRGGSARTVALVDSATADVQGAALVIGRDGTFRPVLPSVLPPSCRERDLAAGPACWRSATSRSGTCPCRAA